jgi:hypothetical protein
MPLKLPRVFASLQRDEAAQFHGEDVDARMIGLAYFEDDADCPWYTFVAITGVANAVSKGFW